MFPNETRRYADRAYWEERFEEEQHYEWFARYDRFQEFLQPYLSLDSSILVVGNGTSLMPIELIKDGYRDITATDICPNLIQKLRDRFFQDGLVFEVADVLALPYQDASFDVIIEKGTLDVFFAEADSFWTPPLVVSDRMTTACSEIHRVLKNNGLFFSITFMQPLFRNPFLNKFPWSCHVDGFGDPGSLEYYIYRLKKTTVFCTNEHSSTHEHTIDYDTLHDLDNDAFLLNIDL